MDRADSRFLKEYLRMIIGVTHDSDGRMALRLAVSAKVTIGMPPQGDRNYPSKLDHFVFLRKKKTAKGVEWEPDPDLMKHYGDDCKAFEIMLIDDDINNVFPTSYAWWTATERKCSGDGSQATRRTSEHPTGEPWMPCGGQCAELASGLCKPSGDLRFVLADFPRLGSICRIHTSSYRSIRQIHSALEEIQTFTGSRLAGITAKLVVRPEQAIYFDRKEERKKTTTIWALSLEVDGDDIRKLVANLTGNARLFAQTRKLLGWGEGAIEVVEDEGEQAPEIASEFYPPSEQVSDAGKSSDGPNSHAQESPHSTARDGSQGHPGAASNAATKRPSKSPIMEPKRKADMGQREPKSGSDATASSVNGVRRSDSVEDARSYQSAGVDGQSKITKLRGIVGRLEPDAAGNTVRRTEKGVEYLIFTMGQNGSKTKVFCKQHEMMREIARRQGSEAVAEVEVATDGKQPCYILNAFVEG
jgi:Recombination directionality factor-like